MKNGIRSIVTLFLQVANLERSVKFYRDGLGLSLVKGPFGHRSVQATLGETRFILHQDFDATLKETRRGAGITIHFGVVDARAYCNDLRSRGLTPDADPTARPWGLEFSITDPDGYILEFLQPAAAA